MPLPDGFAMGPGYTRASGFGPQGRDPRTRPAVTPPQFRPGLRPRADLAPAAQPQFQPVRQPPPQALRYGQPPQPPPQQYRKTSLTAAEQFWYALGNVPFAAMYFAKIPAKKALSDFGLAEMTAAERFWYALGCIPFGAMYFCKIPVAKAVEEMQRQR